MSKPFKPQLASPADLDAIRYPIFASPKLDGIRCSIVGGKALSRTLKEIPSRHVFNVLSNPTLEGLDGELIVGALTSPSCYRNTVSMVMADNKVFAFTYYVFDKWDDPRPFETRRNVVMLTAMGLAMAHSLPIAYTGHLLIKNREQLDAYEAEMVAAGHEGIMLADPNATYKFGRATTKGGELLKVKRFEDSEAVVIGVEEEMFNGNEAQTNELGRTKRSTAQAGLVGKGTMGALVVRDVKTGVEFNIGTGFTMADRVYWWNERFGDSKTVKYKSFPVGVKDKPRHPVYLGLRPAGA
jgi:DNA ligase-1